MHVKSLSGRLGFLSEISDVLVDLGKQTNQTVDVIEQSLILLGPCSQRRVLLLKLIVAVLRSVVTLFLFLNELDAFASLGEFYWLDVLAVVRYDQTYTALFEVRLQQTGQFV